MFKIYCVVSLKAKHVQSSGYKVMFLKVDVRYAYLIDRYLTSVVECRFIINPTFDLH